LVRDLTVPGEISVVSIVRDGRAALPTLGAEFRGNDILYLAVLSSAMERVESLLGIGASI
jgi:Trk K+ transport system NAD-binding subunit